jgi:endonuclease/exonuclease/phosphatase family metal-dependent hydrolase
MIKFLNLFLFTSFTLFNTACASDLNPINSENNINILSDTNNSMNRKTFDFKILTYNVWGLPNPLTKNLKERMDLVGKNLSEYDLVNLQESFSDHALKIVENSKFPYAERYDNTSIFHLNSGLTTLSKYPIILKKLKKFTKCAGTDCLSNKSVTLTRVKVEGFGNVDVYNTHYQSMDSKEDIRISSNETVENFIKENDEGNLTILTGDFNFVNFDTTDTNSKSFNDLKQRLNVVDTFRVKNPNSLGITYDWNVNPYAESDGPLKRLDYIFVVPKKDGNANYDFEVLESNLAFNKPVGINFTSDHFGVTTTLRVWSKS